MEEEDDRGSPVVDDSGNPAGAAAWLVISVIIVLSVAVAAVAGVVIW